MKKVQRTQVTFEILTKAHQPLELDDYTQGLLAEAFESAVQSSVNLEYYKDYSNERHDLLAVMVTEVTNK